MVKRPKIDKRLLPINDFSRPGRKLVSIKGIVVHWTANPGAGIDGHFEYFKGLAKQDPDDDKYDRYAGAHYFVDIEGNICQLIPDNEIAYHVGAHEYKDGILDKFNTTYPNNCLIGIEMCHPDWSGEFTKETYRNTVQLVAFLVEHYDLTISDIVRHYDITGKDCPKWFVENEREYEYFLTDVEMIVKDVSNNRKYYRG